MLIKQKNLLFPKNLALGTFGILNKGKSAIPVLFNSLEVLFSALFAENVCKKSNLDDSGISLLVFPSRTNLKLHISVTPKMV